MRVGVDLPYFADPGEIRAYAQAVEDLGFAHLGFSEHVAASRATAYPAGFDIADPWHETFTLLGFLAAATGRIELNPSMLLLTLRPAVLAAKQAAEIDLLSGGRLRPAASVGWNAEECRALGVDPRSRGRLIEEQVTVLRRLWSEDDVSYDGELIRLDRVAIHPRPGRAIPLWMGGGGFGTGGFPLPRTVDRAARLADGFKLMAPTGLDPARATALITDLRDRASAYGRESFGVEARIISQATTEDDWPGLLETWRTAGATHVGLANRIAGGSVDDQIAHVARFAEVTRALW